MFDILITIICGILTVALAFGVFMLFVAGIRYLKTWNAEDDEDDQDDEDGDEDDDEDLYENIYREIVEIRKILEDLHGS